VYVAFRANNLDQIKTDGGCHVLRMLTAHTCTLNVGVIAAANLDLTVTRLLVICRGDAQVEQRQHQIGRHRVAQQVANAYG